MTPLIFEIQNLEQYAPMIPENELKEIQEKKERVEVYRAAREGVSNSSVVGTGKKILTWSRESVQKLGDLIEKGLAVFHLHGKTNSHEGRKPLGKVIEKWMEPDGSLMIAVRRFKDGLEKITNVASLEAVIQSAGEIINPIVSPADLVRVTAVALGDSREASPAFKDARKTVEVQFFDVQFFSGIREKDSSPDNSEQGIDKGDNMPKLTLEELQEAIQEGGYSLKDLGLDGDQESKFQNKMRESERHRKGKEDALKEVETWKAKHGELSTENLKLRAKIMLPDLLKKRDKLTEQEKAFIVDHITNFTPGQEKDLEKDIESFADTQLTQMADGRKYYIADTPTNPPANTGNIGNIGNPGFQGTNGGIPLASLIKTATPTATGNNAPNPIATFVSSTPPVTTTVNPAPSLIPA